MKTKKTLLAFVAISTFNLQLLTFNCTAQTSIPAGTVSGTWTLAGSPYNIQGSIQIVDATTLTIQPGVTVNFQGMYKLNVQGRLLAIGTAADTIIFTATNTTNGWRGIRFDQTPSTNDSSKRVYCKLQYGNATGAGMDAWAGALYFLNFSKALVSNCRISNCNAGGGGGGIYFGGSSPIITYNSICNNTSGFGGAIYCNGSSPTISNNTISNNTAGANGGGINCEGCNSIISNNIFSNNTAASGGGINCSNSSPTIIGNIISDNTSNGSNGGGINCEGSNPQILNNIISNNTAGANGGGINCQVSSPFVSNNILSNNNAAFGGGICCYNGANPTFINTTISNNVSANGGVVYCDAGSSPLFRNCILWGNTASSSGLQVFINDEQSDPNFYYCDVQGGTSAFELNGNNYTLRCSNTVVRIFHNYWISTCNKSGKDI